MTVTCAGNAEGLVRGLGADEVVDYTAGDVAAQLEATEKCVQPNSPLLKGSVSETPCPHR